MRWFRLCLCGIVSAALVTGCEHPGVGTKKKVVGIALPAKQLERWNRDGSFLKKAFENEGYQVILSYSDNNAINQQKDVEQLLKNKPDILILAAVDGERISEELQDIGIPVIAYDRLIRNTDAISYYVSYDNYKVGELQGEHIIDTLKLGSVGKKTFNMEITQGDPVDNNAVYYYNGAMDTLKPYIDGGVINIPSGEQSYEKTGISGWDTAKARARMQNIIKKYYKKKKLNIALCANDSTALGVTQAIEAVYQGKNTPIITGQDGDEENLKNLLDGKQSMTVYKSLKNECTVTFELAKQILSGKEPKAEFCKMLKDTCEVSYDTKSYDNGVLKVPSFLLVPQAVTKKNYQKVLVDTGDYSVLPDGSLKAAE